MADVKIRVVGEDAASKELGKVNKSLEEMKGAAGKAGESGKGMGVDWEIGAYRHQPGYSDCSPGN